MPDIRLKPRCKLNRDRNFSHFPYFLPMFNPGFSCSEPFSATYIFLLKVSTGVPVVENWRQVTRFLFLYHRYPLSLPQSQVEPRCRAVSESRFHDFSAMFDPPYVSFEGPEWTSITQATHSETPFSTFRVPLPPPRPPFPGRYP